MVTFALSTIVVEKPWGRETLWPGFENPGGARIGELWFQVPDGVEAPLLVKYLFTSEKLSIQVHEDDAAAQAAGRPRGKDEAWVILAAEPEATIALGMRERTSAAAVRNAALDGSIADLVDWKPVAAGDVIYSPAGTIHAIGAGLTLIEVQQNVDLTFRLFDYGRPRPLQLDEAMAVVDPVPFENQAVASDLGDGRRVLCQGGKFVLERWSWSGERAIVMPIGISGWLIPVSGSGAVDGAPFRAGECWMIDGDCAVMIEPGSDILFAYPLASPADLFTA